MASKIGIKLADGTFFPILDEDALSEQSLELTTVRENQESVQINLFKQFEETEPEYIGSLIVEDISTGPAGDPTINLKIKLDEEKNLSAEAMDEGSGSHQSLRVSLKNLDETSLDGIDFDFAPLDDSSGFESSDDDYFIKEGDETSFDDSFETETHEETQLHTYDEERPEKKKKMPMWLIILIIILCITALVFAILLLTKKMPFADKDMIASAPEKVEQVQEPKKDVNATTSNAPKEDAEEKAAAEAKRKAEEEARQKAEAKKKADEEAKQKAAEAKKKADEEAKQKAAAKKKADSKKKSKVNAKGAVRYKIKWGDTLWDLSETYYKTPWLYKKIADYNKIKNPNLIVAGTYIDIPPK
ncbi:LysM peptidoglycan-binding domain-containing protein [Treponema sp. OMZ 788]|uniref:Hsp70 family protein n=1 Tax=unclassified Treponema TaxID=2638727 RepID=UPI0020A24601|nr:MULTISPECIES: LysM peptidoglycan-binding domain-containing protein [unclassified Treponema]UTC61981.1 LysM peptidoglycan-binding domain-containing protein [Treponema sp. OMZ 787]UTC65027.1 LysM peptidoglycan-binding domain-containing protein [Treponema sp. OMZ 788]